MFTNDMPKIVAGFFDLLDAVERHFSTLYTIERLSRQGERGLIFRDASGSGLLYVGLRWDLWDRLHQPLWLGVQQGWGDSTVAAFNGRHQGRCFCHDGYSFCPLDPAAAGGPADAEGLIALLEKELASIMNRV